MKVLIADKFEKSGIDALNALGVEVISQPDLKDAALAAYHQAAARKIFPMQVLWIFVPLVLLELARIYRQRTPRRTPTQAVAS